jgi:hypothetical protein
MMLDKSFVGIHAGKIGILYGKGPSLARHIFSREEVYSVRIAINDAGYVVPHADFLFLHDPIKEAIEIMDRTIQRSPEVKIVLPNLGRACPWMWHEGIRKHSKRMVWYDKTWALPYDARPGALYHGHCTAHSALHFFHVLGIRHVKLVGLDGVASQESLDRYFVEYPVIADATKKDIENDENFLEHHNSHLARYRRMLFGMALLLDITIEDYNE